MAKEVTVTVDEAATVEVVGGVEYERRTADVDAARFNRERMVDKARQAIPVLEGHVANWGNYTTAEQIAATRQMMRAVAWLLRQFVSEYGSEGPPGV